MSRYVRIVLIFSLLCLSSYSQKIEKKKSYLPPPKTKEVKKEEGVTICPFPANTEEAGNDAATVTATPALAVVVIKFLREFFELLMVNEFILKLLHLG